MAEGLIEKQIRVTRVLVFEGPESWVRETLERSWLGLDRPLQVSPDKKAIEISRTEEIVS